LCPLTPDAIAVGWAGDQPAARPPTPQAYGIDSSFRDPSGNNIRLTQVMEFDPARGSGL
jgi:hypothetical protein